MTQCGLEPRSPGLLLNTLENENTRIIITIIIIIMREISRWLNQLSPPKMNRNSKHWPEIRQETQIKKKYYNSKQKCLAKKKSGNMLIRKEKKKQRNKQKKKNITRGDISEGIGKKGRQKDIGTGSSNAYKTWHSETMK